MTNTYDVKSFKVSLGKAVKSCEIPEDTRKHRLNLTFNVTDPDGQPRTGIMKGWIISPLFINETKHLTRLVSSHIQSMGNKMNQQSYDRIKDSLIIHNRINKQEIWD